MGLMNWIEKKLNERRERYAALEAHMDKMDSIMDRQQLGGNHPLDTLDEIAVYDREQGNA